jgi:hypothetical protein
MKHWKYSFLPLIMALPTVWTTQPAVAQPAPAVRAAARLREVTVYRAAAELSQTAECAVAAGITEVRLSGLAPRLLAAGFQVEVTGGELLASSFRPVTPRRTASDSLAPAWQRLRRLEAEQEGLTQEREFLMTNRSLPTDNRTTWTADLQKNAAYYRTRMTELALRREELTRDIAEQKTLLGRLETAGEQKGAPVGIEAVLRIQAARAGNVQLAVRYVVPGSRWQPRHDVRPWYTMARASTGPTCA